MAAALGCALCGLLWGGGPPGVWLDVPFIKQVKEGCGAASIAMVMRYWSRQKNGAEVDPDAIYAALYSREGHGIYASDMEDYFREHGFITFSFAGEWGDLKQHLEKGRPLIVALKPSSREPVHYAVVTGMDWERGLILINDPAQRKLLKQDKSSFEREWSAAEKWTLLALLQNDSH
jgi:ABC-type bacteriocin/lantibiotic exporter with double-glycine peptidase domain